MSLLKYPCLHCAFFLRSFFKPAELLEVTSSRASVLQQILSACAFMPYKAEIPVALVASSGQSKREWCNMKRAHWRGCSLQARWNTQPLMWFLPLSASVLRTFPGQQHPLGAALLSKHPQCDVGYQECNSTRDTRMH